MQIQTKFFDILQRLLHTTTVIINIKMTFQIDTDLKAISANHVSAPEEPMRRWYGSNQFENPPLVCFDKQNSVQMENEKTFTWLQMILFALSRPRVNYNRLTVSLINFVKSEHLRLAFIL